MLHYTNDQLASLISLPIVTILLFWTVAIFQKNRKRWHPYDIPIVSLLILSIIRNMTILTYTLFVTLNQNTIDLDYCSAIIWLFNSIHTFQASSLTTLAIIGLFSVKLHRQQQHLRQYLTPTHLIYHLFCLTTLCACVGVAAILAQNQRGNFKNITIFDTNPCKFMPFDLDVKYNVFIIVLHVFLASVSLCAFFGICVNHLKLKQKENFDYLQKSNSDLSDLSLQQNVGGSQQQKGYYDTYTIQRNHHNHNFNGQNHQDVGMCYDHSDISNISNTVSSTNSRRPCLSTSSRKDQDEERQKQRTGLETIHPVLIVCYLFYHLPLIVLCIYPNLIAPWPIAGVALWLGLVQDLLIPIGLSIVDSRFCKWVNNVYKCTDRRHGNDKLPHVGLDGKFRPFTSQPQSLEVAQNMVMGHNLRTLQTVEHRFPITNGSLYTSIDGRLPVIHNYRRHNKDQRSLACKPNDASASAGHYDYACRNCETDLCPSHSNLHHLSPHYINKQLNLLQTNKNYNFQMIQKSEVNQRSNLSQENLKAVYNHSETILKNSRNLVRLNKMRLCKSEDSLTEIPSEELQKQQQLKTVYSSSDDDDEEYDHRNDANTFDSLSSQSSYSITTEANCDFEFFAKKPAVVKMTSFKEQKLDGGTVDFKITRSNSKRSLENFCAYLVEETNHKRQEKNNNSVQRSNSYMTLEDRKRRNRQQQVLMRSNSKLSDCTYLGNYLNNNGQKMKSVEYLPSSNASTVYVEDVFYFNYPKQRQQQFNNNINANVNDKSDIKNQKNFGNSVPDLKKVFISEYI